MASVTLLIIVVIFSRRWIVTVDQLEKKSEPTEKPNLSPAEWEVMKVFWNHGKLPAREAYTRLPSGHGWAIKTLKTLLARLVNKGALVYQQVGNSYHYQAKYSRDEMTDEELRDFTERILDGRPASAISKLLHESNLDSQDLTRIRQILEEKEKQAKLGRKH